MIVYKLEAAFDIMVAHEKRHFKQAQENKPSSVKPKCETNHLT